MATVVYESFEWDEAKNESNAAKHGLRFEEACTLFRPPYYASPPYWHKSGEIRCFIVGLFRDKETTVVYTLRNGRIRIISARSASHEEKNEYRNRCGA